MVSVAIKEINIGRGDVRSAMRRTGISAAHLPFVFRRFYRVVFRARALVRTRYRIRSGVRALIHAQRGQIRAQSVEGGDNDYVLVANRGLNVS